MTCTTWCTSPGQSPSLARTFGPSTSTCVEWLRGHGRGASRSGSWWALLRSGMFWATTPQDRPSGAYFVFELAWRGVTYGAVDAPSVERLPRARGVHDPPREGRRLRREGSLRGSRAAARPDRHGDVPPRLPAVQGGRRRATRDWQHDHLQCRCSRRRTRLGLSLAHATMHTTALAHAYETPTYLPPET